MRIRSLITAAALAAVASSASAALIYNPVVTMIGDGNAIVSGQSRTTTLQVYANTVPGAPLSSLAYNSGSTGTRLTNSDSATSEGALSNNPGTADAAAAGVAYGGAIYTFSAGYDAPNATASVNGTAANAPRVVGYMNATNNTLTSPTIGASQPQANAYDNNNFRSATGDDTATNFWTGGTGSTATTAGWRYFNSNTQLSTTNSTNVRTTEIRNGQLFGSTGSATRGIYAIGSGIPTASGNTANLLIGTGASSSPYEFVLIDDPANSVSTASTFGYDTAYIADDSAISSNGGIQKWVWNGSSWSNTYTLNDGIGGNRGLAGQLDAATGNVTLWATTAAGDKLEQVTDLGAGAASPFITLATAQTNYLFRGVALTTGVEVPEPATASLFVTACLFALRRRRSPRSPICLPS